MNRNDNSLAAIERITVIDNHCHPILRDQRIDTVRWRRAFSEAHDPAVAEHDVPSALYYRWALRQIAAFLDVEPTEDAILLARLQQPLGDYMRRLARDANIACLVIDEGYPAGDEAYTAAQTADLFAVKGVRLLRLETLVQRLAVETESFDAAEEAFRRIVHDVRANYVGLKSIAAYRTGLVISPVEREEARLAFTAVQAEARARGAVRLATKPVVDYFVCLALAEADQQRLPIQFHTGYGDPDLDLQLANPLHLRAVIERYPRAPIVLLHESYPYTREAAFLAAVYPNVYVDISAVIPFLGREEIAQAFQQALNVAPASRILYSSDATNLPELHWLGPSRARTILREVLGQMVHSAELDAASAVEFAQLILHDNAVRLYQLADR
jgi:predicted TIM-barrel fold metal-dependent hydrolase